MGNIRVLLSVLSVVSAFGACSGPVASEAVALPPSPPDRVEEVTLIIDCWADGGYSACDTFYAPDRFIMQRFTKGAPPEMIGFVRVAWNGKSYRHIETEETDSTIYFYYQNTDDEELGIVN